MKTAVIDLGTNTSNLLIAEISETGFNILHQSKLLVKLGDSRIKDNQISNEGLERVLDVLGRQKKITDSEGVEKVHIIATSAIREASNREILLEAVNKKMNCQVTVVSGAREAELIFRGVILAMDNLTEKSLIIDIGGGSNEFILAHHKKIYWKESQPTGMARIVNQFVLSDPLRPNDIKLLQNFFSARFRQVIQKCKKKAVNTMIGCSGTFDTIADMIEQTEPGEKQRKYNEIPLDEFYRIHHLLINSNRNQRLSFKGMDSVRVDLIVPAVVLTEHIIKQAGIAKLIHTGYSLREGVLSELLESDGYKG